MCILNQKLRGIRLLQLVLFWRELKGKDAIESKPRDPSFARMSSLAVGKNGGGPLLFRKFEADLHNSKYLCAFSNDDPGPGIPLAWQAPFPVRGTRQIDGELNLFAAVLIDAIIRYQNGCRGGSRQVYRQYLEAKAWIESRDTSSLFAFESVCDVLGLEPDAIRRRLSVLRRSGDQALSVGERRHSRR